MPQPDWIPVAQHLPEADSPALVTDGVSVYYGCYDSRNHDWLLLFGAMPARGTNITHWLPLPTPPGITTH